MTKESIQRAITRIDKGIVTANENIEKGYQVEQSREALEDLQICKGALEKQIPMKPVSSTNVNRDYEILTCPRCGSYISLISTGNYCRCGQKLKWEDTNG